MNRANPLKPDMVWKCGMALGIFVLLAAAPDFVSEKIGPTTMPMKTHSRPNFRDEEESLSRTQQVETAGKQKEAEPREERDLQEEAEGQEEM